VEQATTHLDLPRSHSFVVLLSVSKHVSFGGW
jgi:hypothetical protein